MCKHRAACAATAGRSCITAPTLVIDFGGRKTPDGRTDGRTASMQCIAGPPNNERTVEPVHQWQLIEDRNSRE